ncbi:MAG: hypothetical protein KAW90_07325 [Dehalococcoidales bacterium]|nr:hypothetical protein [Dehalococcoidales bacterium]
MRQDIRERLIDVARAGEVIFYLELRIGRGRAAGRILEEISNYEWNNSRPLLTAIVANRAKGMPSPGFWGLPAVPQNLTEKQRPIFWAREVLKVIDYWQNH